MCPKGSGPHSAAKQHRSFRVALIKSRRSRPPKPHSAAKQRRSFRVALMEDPKPCPSGPELLPVLVFTAEDIAIMRDCQRFIKLASV